MLYPTKSLCNFVVTPIKYPIKSLCNFVVTPIKYPIKSLRNYFGDPDLKPHIIRSTHVTFLHCDSLSLIIMGTPMTLRQR